MTTPMSAAGGVFGAPGGAAARLQEISDALRVCMLSAPGLTAKSLLEIEQLIATATLDIARRRLATSWGDADTIAISELREEARLGTGVRVVGHIAEFPPPRIWQVGEDRSIVATTLTLRASDGATIPTLGIIGDSTIRALRALRGFGTVEFLGRTVLVPTLPRGVRADFALEVIAARRAQSALDALGATRAERQQTDALLEQLRTSGCSPVDHLLREIEAGLGIVGLCDLPTLRQLLRFTILQAVSVGRIGHAPAKLHAIVVGPPAQGKKLIGLAARALNPTCREASPSKISPAGLVGSSSIGVGGWKSNAGLVPLADGGVLLLQDAHAIGRSKIQQIAPILQELVEDGVVRDSTAGGERRDAAVGLVIDLNRLGQVSSGGAPDATDEAPILGIRPLLSRVDLIAEIAPDPQGAWEVSSSLYLSLATAGASPDSAAWVRRARLLVAALRDRHPQIDLAPVTDAMRGVHQRIATENAHVIATMPEAGDVPMRLAISFARLVTASARAHDRSTATPVDVDQATAFVATKLHFLKFAATADDDPSPRNGLDRIREALRGRYGAGTFTESDVTQLYFEVTGDRASDRSGRRWIKALGAKRISRGEYVLPDSAGRRPDSE